MKNSFYVIEEKHNQTGKTYAHAETINNSYNLLHYFKPHKDFTIISINAADSKKQAKEIATFWNDGAKAHNNYYFS